MANAPLDRVAWEDIGNRGLLGGKLYMTTSLLFTVVVVALVDDDDAVEVETTVAVGPLAADGR